MGGGGDKGGRNGRSTHTSSKGQLDRSQPNDQTIESPLKKLEKKHKKLPTAKRVSNSTKTKVA
jgi:hypothetical protein